MSKINVESSNNDINCITTSTAGSLYLSPSYNGYFDNLYQKYNWDNWYQVFPQNQYFWNYMNGCYALYESDKEYLVHVNLPGIKADKVNVKLEDRTLTVFGTKSDEHPNGFRAITYNHSSNVNQCIIFFNPVDFHSAIADLEDGVLTFKISKKISDTTIKVNQK